MQRIPEEELMDTAAQARAYADADYSGPHDAFILYFRTRFPEFRKGKVLDLGCGPADITIRFAEAFPEAVMTGLDGAQEMLTIAIDDVHNRGLSSRITLKRCLLPDTSLPSRTFDAVISNSLLHHLRDPSVLWQTVKKSAKTCASVFIMDLMRPEHTDDAEKLVALHASEAPPILRKDFYNSLLAAYRPDEIRVQLALTGFGSLAVEAVSDRHLVVWGTSN